MCVHQDVWPGGFVRCFSGQCFLYLTAFAAVNRTVAWAGAWLQRTFSCSGSSRGNCGFPLSPSQGAGVTPDGDSGGVGDVNADMALCGRAFLWHPKHTGLCFLGIPE